MSDISSPPISPLPEALNDPTDPNDPDRQDADPPSAPISDPHLDVDADSDNDSILSDIDEAQFEDFDPANIAIEDPIPVDEDNVRLIGRHKRKRDEGVDGEAPKKKKKEGRREKVKKSRKRKDSDDDFSGGQEIEGKRKRKPKAVVDGEERSHKVKERKERPEENEDALTPEERTSITYLNFTNSHS